MLNLKQTARQMFQSGPKINRRKFFIYFFLTLVAVLVTASFKTMVALGSIFKIDQPFLNLKRLTDVEAQTLPNLYASMTGEKDPLQISNAVEFMPLFLSGLEIERRREMNLGLVLLNMLPFFFMFSLQPFYAMDEGKREHFLRRLANGPVLLFPLFAGLKELCFLTYYRLAQNYEKIGYGGPIVEGGVPDSETQEYYQSMIALF